MTLPNFLLIGAMKAGSTSLYQYLKRHPQIFMSPIKEPNFFALEGQVLANPGVTVTHIDDYRALFANVTHEIAIGEASVRYLYSPKAARQIQHYISHAKLIAILRNPIERAFSAYAYQFSRGSDLSPTFDAALALEPERIRQGYDCWWHYQAMGFYYSQLNYYYERFDAAQIQIYLYDDFRDRPQDVVSHMFRFLGVDDQVAIDVDKRHNPTRVPKNMAIHTFLTRPHPIKELIKPLVPQAMRYRFVKKLRTRNLVQPNKAAAAAPRHISNEAKATLITAYRDDILNLQDLIQRDLSHWLL